MMILRFEPPDYIARLLKRLQNIVPPILVHFFAARLGVTVLTIVNVAVTCSGLLAGLIKVIEH